MEETNAGMTPALTNQPTTGGEASAPAAYDLDPEALVARFLAQADIALLNLLVRTGLRFLM